MTKGDSNGCRASEHKQNPHPRPALTPSPTKGVRQYFAFGMQLLPSDRMTSIAGLSGLTDSKEHR